MFGKLLKHELRHTARYHSAILTACIVATAAMAISLFPETDTLFAITTFILFAVAWIIMSAVQIVSLVAVIKNFYDTIFSKQGYLTMTLPVKGGQILLSKLIVSFFWIIVSFAASSLPLFALSKCLESIGAGEMVDEVTQGQDAILPIGTIITSVIIIIALIFIAILCYVSYVYFSVTVANTRLLSKHPKMFGSFVFCAVFTLTTILTSLTNKIAPLYLATVDGKYILTFKEAWEIAGYVEGFTNINYFTVSAIVAVILLFATGYFIEHKINIK